MKEANEYKAEVFHRDYRETIIVIVIADNLLTAAHKLFDDGKIEDVLSIHRVNTSIVYDARGTE